MMSNLRPMTLGEILDRSFKIYRQRFLPVLVSPLYPLAVTLLYYDQRIRHEGFDIEWMMNAAGMNVPALADGPVVPVPAVESGEQPA